MKPFTNAIKSLLALISYIGPLLIIGLDEFSIVFKAIIASITFLYNAFYHYRTSNLGQKFAELKYKYEQDVKRYEEWQKSDSEYRRLYQERLDAAYAENEKLRQEIEVYKKAGKP